MAKRSINSITAASNSAPQHRSRKVGVKTDASAAEKPARRRRKKDKRLTPEALKGRVSLRVGEFSALTGMPEPTVYKNVNNGRLRCARVGNTIFIPVSEVYALTA